MHLPGQPDSRLALAWLLCLFIVLLLLMAGPRLNGQTVSETSALPLSENLARAEQALLVLVTRLEVRQQQVRELQSSLLTSDEKLRDLLDSLVSLQQQLSQAQESQAQSETALTETLTSLDVLSRRFNGLEARWQAYRDEMTTQVAGLEKDLRRSRRWATGFGVAAAVGLLLSVLLALR